MEETITILRVDTGEAVTSVQDLKDNIKALKDVVAQAEIGSEEYQKALNELRVNQNALKDAMYATSASMEDVAKSATGASESYNALVHRMAALKEEFRSTGDAARRMELGAQIKEVNDQLKEMDALQGNFQRNVGNYAGSLKSVIQDIPSFAGPARKGLDDINKSMGLISKNPLMGIITLLFPLIMKITDGLKENKAVLDSIDKAMKALQPVFNVVTKTVETLAGWISKAVDWFVKLLDQNKETFASIVSGAVGVGNAILQYLLTPIRTVVEAAKGLGNIFKDIFTGNWSKIKEDAETAFGGIKDAIGKGFDFKQNFAAGKEAGQKFVDGLLTMKPKAKDAGKAVGASVREGVADELDKMAEDVDKAMDRVFADWQKAEEERNKIAEAQERRRLEAIAREEEVGKRVNGIMIEDAKDLAEAQYQTQLEANEKRLAALRQFSQDALERGDLDKRLEYEQQIADLEVEIELNKLERLKQLDQEAAESAEKAQKGRIDAMQWAANTASGILGSLADFIEANTKDDQKAAKRTKGIRIASAIIDTLNGAVTALSTAQSLGPIAGPIVGAANAAAITTAGMANVAKIRATDVDGGSSGMATAPTVSAPRVDVGPAQTTVIRGAGEEDRLNRMAADQRVYILQSDIEAAGHTSKVQVAESSF